MHRALGVAAVILSGVLIAAHFLRAGLYPLVGLGLAFPFLLIPARPWATRTVQLLLALAAAEWLRTLVQIAAQRRAAGQPWARMAIILGAVALFTLGAAFATRVRRKPGPQ